MRTMRLKGRRRIGGGAEAECFLYSKKRVIKAYNSRQEALNARKRQLRAFKVNLATPVFEFVKVKDERTHDSSYRHKKWGYICGRASSTRLEADEAMLRKARRLRFETHDLCARNLGKWNGHLVIVDFGEMTLRA